MNYIAKAEHAIRTGQPNLAMIYMRRDLSESEKGRRWLERYDAQLRFHASVRAFGKAMEAFAVSYRLAFKAVEEVGRALQPTSHNQEEFALVSDHEG